MRKRRFIAWIFVLVVVGAAIIFFSISLPQRVVVANQLKNDIPVGEVYGEMNIGQTFVAEHNNLSAIEVLLATYNRKNTGKFIFHLKDGLKSKEDIYSFVGDLSKVKDNEFFRFSIPKIGKSKGRKYYFFIESPKAQPGNAITTWSSSKDLYKEGEKIVNGVSAPGDLVFKTEYEQGLRLSAGAFLARTINFVNFFIHLFLNKVFYILLSIIVFIWVFITVIKKFDILNKKGGFILIYCIVLIIVFIWILALFSRKIDVFNQPKNNTPVGEIYGKTKIGQTFAAQYNNLTAIEIRLATYNRKNTGEFIFHLKKDPGSKEDLFNYKGDIGRLKDNKYFRFRFPEIKFSKGKKFYFYLEAPQSRPGNAITIWANSEDLYREGEKMVDGGSAQGDLVFKTLYDLGLRGNLGVFLNEITQNKPSPLNKKSFYITLILLFVFSCALFITALVRFFCNENANANSH